MPDTTTNKQILKPTYTEYASDATGWTNPINGNWNIIDTALGGTHPVTLSSANVTLTKPECQNLKIKITGSIGSTNLTVFFPTGISSLFVVENLTSGTGIVTLASAGAGGTSRTAVRGANTLIWLDASTNSVTLADNAPVTGGTGITVSGSTIALTTPVSTVTGGTGQTTYSAGQLLIGNSSGGLTPARLTEGANIGIVNGNGTITISATGTVAGVNTVSAGTTGLTPNVATAGAVTLGGTLNVSSGGTGATTLTGYVKGSGTTAMTASATVPTSDLSGTVGVANGGTGASTLTGYVKGSGTSAMTASATIPGSDVSGAYTASTLSMASNRLLGRQSSNVGSAEEIAIGSGLTLAGGILSASLTSGVSSISFGTTGLTPAATTTGAISVAGTLTAANGGTGATTLTGYVYGNGTGVMTASANIPNTAITGLGNMSTQAANNVTITGGSLASMTHVRVNTASALSTAESLPVLAPINTDGIVSKVTTNSQFNFVGQSSSGVENFTVNGNGVLIAGTTFFTGARAKFQNDTDWGLEAYQSGTGLSGGGAAAFCVNSTTNVLAGFYFNGTLGSGAPQVGSITTNGTGVTYGTASDYRLKENVVNFSDGVSVVKNLRPVNFTWKSSPSVGTVNGFIAHEVQAIVPQAVAGEKDSVNADGFVKPQTIDHSMLVPVLTSAIKELIARVEALEAR